MRYQKVSLDIRKCCKYWFSSQSGNDLPIHTIDRDFFSPKTLVLLVLPGTVAKLEESIPSAESEEEPRATRQRATSSVTNDSYESCTVVCEECEAALSIRRPPGGDMRLPQR